MENLEFKIEWPSNIATALILNTVAYKIEHFHSEINLDNAFILLSKIKNLIDSQQKFLEIINQHKDLFISKDQVYLDQIYKVPVSFFFRNLGFYNCCGVIEDIANLELDLQFGIWQTGGNY